MGHKIQTYKFGNQYEDLWSWLSSQQEDFRVITLPAPYPTKYVDQKQPAFSYDIMSLYPGKPNLYIGHIYSPKIIRFTFKNFYTLQTSNLGSFLGPENIKYIIFDKNKVSLSTDVNWINLFPDEYYSNDKISETLSKQKDFQLIKTIDNIDIYNNTDFIPHLYPANEMFLVVGNLDAIMSMINMENINMKSISVVFIDQLSPQELILLDGLPNQRVLVSEDNYIGVPLSLIDPKYNIKYIEYIKEKDPTKGWILFDWPWHDWYLQTSINNMIFTMSKSNIEIPFNVENKQDYDIYVKTLKSDRSSSLTFYVDDAEIGDIVTYKTGQEKIEWVSLKIKDIIGGQHNLKIKSGGGEEYIAGLFISPSEEILKAQKRALEMLDKKKVILVSELENWNCQYSHSKYYLFDKTEASLGKSCWLTEQKNKTLTHEVYIPKDGLYNITLRMWTNQSSFIGLKIENFNLETYVNETNKFYNYKVGNLSLNEGPHFVSVYTKDNKDFFVDQIVFEEQIKETQNEINFSFKKINPTKYEIEFDSKEPFYLVFSERNHQNWKIITQDNKEISNLPSFSFGNAYFLNYTGHNKMELAFLQQKKLDFILITNLLYFILLFIFILTRIQLTRSFFIRH